MINMNTPDRRTPLDRPDGLLGQPLDRVDGPRKGHRAGDLRLRVWDRRPRTASSCRAGDRARAASAASTRGPRSAPGVVAVLTYRNAPEAGRGKPAGLAATCRRQDHALRSAGRACGGRDLRAGARRGLSVKSRYDRERAPSTWRQAAKRARAADRRKTRRQTAPTGDFAAAFAAAPVKIDVNYTTPPQSHAMMEPHATLAYGRRPAHAVHRQPDAEPRPGDAGATMLEMPKENVRFVSRYIGGGFGAKLQRQPDAILAALAAQVIKRPVKLALTRQQVFHVTTHRSDTIQRMRLGADARRHADGDRPSILVGQHAGRAVLRGRRQRDPHRSTRRRTALTRHRLAALDLPVASVDARAGRGGRPAGARMRHGRTGRAR